MAETPPEQLEEKMGNEGNQQETQQGFDYEKLASILDGRQKATEESVLKGYFKEQGLTGDEMAQAIESFKSQRQQSQPDIDGMQRQIADLQGAIEAANKAAVKAKVENAVVVEATKLGIDPKAIPYLARMADLSAAYDAAGDVDAGKVAEAVGKVLDDLPALRPSAQEQKGFRIGGEMGEQSVDDSKLRRALGVRTK